MAPVVPDAKAEWRIAANFGKVVAVEIVLPAEPAVADCTDKSLQDRHISSDAAKIFKDKDQRNMFY